MIKNYSSELYPMVAIVPRSYLPINWKHVYWYCVKHHWPHL